MWIRESPQINGVFIRGMQLAVNQVTVAAAITHTRVAPLCKRVFTASLLSRRRAHSLRPWGYPVTASVRRHAIKGTPQIIAYYA